MTAYNLSSPGQSEIILGDSLNPAIFLTGEAVKVKCKSQTIGSDPNTVFKWRLYSNTSSGSTNLNLTPNMKDHMDAVESETCHYSREGWIVFNVTSTSTLECYLYNANLSGSEYQTPADERPQFYVTTSVTGTLFTLYLRS